MYASIDLFVHRDVIARRIAGLSGLWVARFVWRFLHVTANSITYSSSLRFMVCTLCSILGSSRVALPAV